MTRRSSIITAAICTIALVTVALLLVGSFAGNTLGRVRSPARVVQTNISLDPSVSANANAQDISSSSAQDGPQANEQPEQAGFASDRTGADVSIEKSGDFPLRLFRGYIGHSLDFDIHLGQSAKLARNRWQREGRSSYRYGLLAA